MKAINKIHDEHRSLAAVLHGLKQLAHDAEDDFNKVFGREFMGTYMEQVKRLRGSR